MTRDEIFARIVEILSKTFEIDPVRITPGALLFQELDLDSIDAIDLVVQLQEWTGRHVPEEGLRAVRTVDDVVNLVEKHLADGVPEGAPPEVVPPGGSGSGDPNR
jgi:acyl carrier protein